MSKCNWCTDNAGDEDICVNCSSKAGDAVDVEIPPAVVSSAESRIKELGFTNVSDFVVYAVRKSLEGEDVRHS